MEEEQFNDAMMDELEDLEEDKSSDSQEDSYFNQLGLQEAYGAPEPEEQQNPHTFLHKAAFDAPDTVKTTNLNEYELGRPLFSMRFLLDLHDVCKFYIDPIAKDLKTDNKIALYFWDKIQNISSSGMSKDGFAMNLNVTRKLDTTKNRIKNLDPINNDKRR